MTTTERITAVAEKIEARKQDRARAEAAHDAAVQARDKAYKRLKDDFKVSSVEEGQKLAKKLQKKIMDSLAEAEAVLGD